MSNLGDARSFYAATVPVSKHFMTQLTGLLVQADGDTLNQQLAPDMLSCGEQISIAQGFVPRMICPVVGRATVKLVRQGTSPDDLMRRHSEVMEFLGALSIEDFAKARDRTIGHRAGEADLSQSATDFVTLYALPNMMFHISMAYACLRMAGLAIGKADFDGFHNYGSDTDLT